MSSYTTTVYKMCQDMYIEDTGFPTTNHETMIENARKRIFNFSYPIFEENYRKVLETKILKHYYMREIGFETFGLWRFKMNTKLNEIMPYYNQLYESEKIKFDPLQNTDYWTNTDAIDETEHGKTLNAKDTENLKKERNRKDVLEHRFNSTDTNNYASDIEHKKDTQDVTEYGKKQTTEYGMNTTTTYGDVGKTTTRSSDTPQGSLENIENNKYLTNAQIQDTNSHGNGTDKKSGKDTVTLSNKDSLEHKGSDYDYHRGKDYLERTGDNTDIDTDRDITTEHNGRTHDEKEGGKTKNTLDNDVHVHGKTGSESYSELLNKFRDTFLNIDMMVINELEDLFMQVF